MRNHIPISFKRKKSRDYRRTPLGLKRSGNWQNRWDEYDIDQGYFETYKEGDVRDLLDAVVKGYVMEDPVLEENNLLPNDYEKKYPKYPPKRVSD
jgi:hypothetical protein